MASLGLPFQGKIWYYVESAYGSGPSSVGELPISVKVVDAKPGVGDKHKKLRGIDKREACYLLEQCNDFTFHLEYIPQVGDTLFEDVNISDPSDCRLETVAFVLVTNDCLGADQSIYLISGAKVKTTRVSASHNTEYMYVMDFSVESIVTASSPTGYSEPAALTGDICAFNVAGSITKDGGDFAYILNSIDVTIDQGIKDYWDHDSLEKQFAIEGEFNVEGSVDISLDEGGAMHFAEVLAQDDFTIVLNLGAAGAPKITINNCKWKNSSIDVNISGEDMKESAPFTGKTISYATV
ncbi:MAG: hypothetical protein EHM34_00095 [Nitrosopumilales archaeon]|nr:MAG: hypothetical protein EHM34_00095 [Nitrosopumilales archaeon]